MQEIVSLRFYFEKKKSPTVVEVSSFDKFTTERGNEGLGSTEIIKNMVINNYAPEYMPENLPWYERDGLLTWYDQVKCKEFLEDTDAHFKNKKTEF